MKLILISLTGLLFWGPLCKGQKKAPYDRRGLEPLLNRMASQIWRTFPDRRVLPFIKVVQQGQPPLIARFKPDPQPTLYVNETLLDLCQSFGPDSLAALALVMGHELTHYHANHKDWLDIAQDSTSRKQKSMKPDQLNEKLNNERFILESLADREGVLHAYLAGYDGFRLVKPFYERLYQVYHLGIMPEYPSLEKRIALSMNQVNTARPNALLVDASLFLYTLGEYDLAEDCLIATTQHWPLATLQNNLAALYLKKALNLTNCKEMPFWLPVEWDNYNRLLTLRGSMQESEKAATLEHAQEYAMLAHRTDPDYAPATLNLAIAHLLSRHFGTAEDLLDELTQQSSANPNAQLVKAILRLKRTNNLTIFRQDFAAITGSANESVNQAALNHWPACPPSPEAGSPLVPTSAEPGLGTIRFPLSFPNPSQVSMNVSGRHDLQLTGQYDQTTSIDLFRIMEKKLSRYEVLKTTSSTWPTARGLRVSQPESSITAHYGIPDTRIDLNGQYSVYHYKQVGLLVTVRDGLVCQVSVYRKNF